MTTPSIQARNLAVKPAGFRDWKHYTDDGYTTQSILGVTLLAYAADLDKADKVAKAFERVAEKGMIDFPVEQAVRLREEVRSMLLPDPIDPLLAAWKADHQDAAVTREYMQGLEAAFDWIAKRELAKEQDRG